MSDNKLVLKTDPRIAKFVEDNIYVEGRKINFDLYEPMKFVYNLAAPELLVLAGRQIGKSVYLAVKAATKSVLIPNNRILYVSPLEAQAKTWSKTKLGPVIKDSPYLDAFYKKSGNNVFFKENTLGSYIELTYASLADADPARVRGKSADDLFIDETQDIVPDALPVIKEVITSSLNPFVTYAGTAKSSENLTGIIWDKGTKIERVYKCPSCSKLNIITRESISAEGLICIHCRKRLNQHQSKFMVTEKKDNRFTSIRLPQVIMPIHQTHVKWKEVWNKYETYSADKFNQEVLGIPAGAGARTLSLEDLKKHTQDRTMQPMFQPEWARMYKHIIIGVDWSGEGLENKSKTAVIVMGVRQDFNIDVLDGSIIPAGNPSVTLKSVGNKMLLHKAHVLSADAGMGAYQNSILMQEYGSNKVLQIQYSGTDFASGSKYIKEKNAVMINKTAAIDTIIKLLKHEYISPHLTKSKNKRIGINWPNLQESMPFFKDILAEFSQESKSGRKIWTHAPDVPDDALHALVFGVFGWMFAMTGKVYLY